MTSRDSIDMEYGRVRIVLVAMVVGLLGLAAALWRMQILGHETSAERVTAQSMRRVRLPATRGRILDRSGARLADTRPSYCVAVYVEELRQRGRWENTVQRVDQTLDDLSRVLRLRREVSEEEIWAHIRRRLPLPLLAWRDVNPETLARWAESSTRLRGVDIYVEPVRLYPGGVLASHVLGYVGRAAPQQDDLEPFHFYFPESEGRSGIEAVMNGALAGVAGGRLLRVDASGFRYESRDRGHCEATAGLDVVLTIDARIQRLAEEALSGEVGAAVVLDPRNGDVLAMASSPAYDPNLFSPAIQPAQWEQLRDGKDRPLVDRAIAGLYPPGSTFKPIVALTALENGLATENTTFTCGGTYVLGKASFSCWQKEGHGTLNLREAIERSCNVYFCQLGQKVCGYEKIRRMADSTGFGRRTGVELTGEADGILPAYRRGWMPGDTCNISIGQGALAVTPLQMAVFAAALGNGGYVYRPRLLTGRWDPVGEGTAPPGDLVKKLPWSEGSLAVVRRGLYAVVQSEFGSGKRARLPNVEMGGKTGTAEYGVKDSSHYHTWMIVFAPFERPRYAAAVVIENGVSGGITVAPRIRRLMEGVFALEGNVVTAAGPRGDGRGSPVRTRPGERS